MERGLLLVEMDGLVCVETISNELLGRSRGVEAQARLGHVSDLASDRVSAILAGCGFRSQEEILVRDIRSLPTICYHRQMQNFSMTSPDASS